MKAVYATRYGTPDVLEIRTLPRPAIGDADILVEVQASPVTTADWRLRAAAFPNFAVLPGRLMFGLTGPRKKVPGMNFSGRVVARGAGVTRFDIGDEVFGVASGAHAEFVRINAEGAVVHKPDGITHVEAAAAPFGALSALVFLRDFAGVQPGQSVLIVGASGGLGVYLVQLAKHFGAVVTGVASAANSKLVTDLGADHFIDYASTDFTTTGQRFDVILDVTGTVDFRRARRVLTDRGVFVPIEFQLREIWQALKTSISGRQKVIVNVSGDKREDLETIAGLLGAGHLRAVIDSVHPMSQIATAHRRVESRHATGSVVIFPATAATTGT